MALPPSAAAAAKSAPFVRESQFGAQPLGQTPALPPPVAAAAAKGAQVAEDLVDWTPSAAKAVTARPLELERVNQLPVVVGGEQDISELQQVLTAKDKEFKEAIAKANDARLEMITILLLLKGKAERLKGDVSQCDEKTDRLLTPGLLNREGELNQFRADFGALFPAYNALEQTHCTVVPAVQDLLHTTQEVARDLNNTLLEMDSAKQRVKYMTLATSIPVAVRRLLENSEAVFRLGLRQIKDYEKVQQEEYDVWKDALKGLKAEKEDLLKVDHGSEKPRIHVFFKEIKEILNNYGKNQQFALCNEESDEKGPYAIWDAAEQKRVIEESSKTYNPLQARYLQLRNDTADWWNRVLERISLYQVKLKLIKDMRASQTLCTKLIEKTSGLYSRAQVARHTFEGLIAQVKWETPLLTFKSYQEEHLNLFKVIHTEMLTLQKQFTGYKENYKKAMEKYANRANYAKELENYATHDALKTDQVDARLVAFRESLKGEYTQCNIILTTLMAALEKKAWELALDLDRHEYAVLNNLQYVPERRAFWFNAGYYYGWDNFLTARKLLQSISTPPTEAPPASSQPEVKEG